LTQIIFPPAKIGKKGKEKISGNNNEITEESNIQEE